MNKVTTDYTFFFYLAVSKLITDKTQNIFYVIADYSGLNKFD